MLPFQLKLHHKNQGHEIRKEKNLILIFPNSQKVKLVGFIKTKYWYVIIRKTLPPILLFLFLIISKLDHDSVDKYCIIYYSLLFKMWRRNSTLTIMTLKVFGYHLEFWCLVLNHMMWMWLLAVFQEFSNHQTANVLIEFQLRSTWSKISKNFNQSVSCKGYNQPIINQKRAYSQCCHQQVWIMRRFA